MSKKVLTTNGKTLKWKAIHDPIHYAVERYLIDNPNVRLARVRGGWCLVGPSGVFHRSRVPGSGLYSSRTARQLEDRTLVVPVSWGEDGQPEAYARNPDRF